MCEIFIFIDPLDLVDLVTSSLVMVFPSRRCSHFARRKRLPLRDSMPGSLLVISCMRSRILARKDTSFCYTLPQQGIGSTSLALEPQIPF